MEKIELAKAVASLFPIKMVYHDSSSEPSRAGEERVVVVAAVLERVTESPKSKTQPGELALHIHEGARGWRIYRVNALSESDFISVVDNSALRNEAVKQIAKSSSPPGGWGYVINMKDYLSDLFALWGRVSNGDHSAIEELADKEAEIAKELKAADSIFLAEVTK